jgi:response regulator RpfG family c-di-GMP phosphodiesterase
MTIKTKTVLIVDDEVVNLRMLERLLRSHYSVLTATNGVAALEILKREDVSVLISDQRMPGMTGIELLRESRNINPDLVGLLVTASTDNETSIEAINDAGALRVIHKPWAAKIVLQFIDEAMAQRETLIEGKLASADMESALRRLRLAAEELNLFSE